MSWFKKVFSSQSSQETKVACKIPKKDKKDNEDPQISSLKIEVEKEGQENAEETSQECWFSSWSGLSTTFDSPKVKKENSVMTMRKRISGGVHFVANKEMKAKANRFSLIKQALEVNHHKQQTYQPKLLLTWMIIKKMTIMKMTARWSFFLELENKKILLIVL